MTNFFGSFRTSTGEVYSGFYHDLKKWHADTTGAEILAVIDLCIHGRTYAKRKECLNDTALAYSELDAPMSWGEVAEFQNYFRTHGAEYGLLADFRENGIC